MERELFAVCPRCGKRARIISHRWDWDEGQDYALAQCSCGRYEVPYDEGRVVEIDLDNPYMPEEHFRLLMPVNRDSRMWTTVGGCLMENWVHVG